LNPDQPGRGNLPSRAMRSNTARRVGSARVSSHSRVGGSAHSRYISNCLYIVNPPMGDAGRKFAEKACDPAKPQEGFRMIGKLLLQNSFFVIVMGALLFAVAGTCTGRGMGVPDYLGGDRPGLRVVALPDRSGAARRTDAADVPGRPAQGRQAIHAAVRGRRLDLAGRDGARPAPPGLGHAARAAGAGPCDVSGLDRLHHVVFRENSFAAPVVRVQAERGHHVVSSGPYAFVRHPMYSASRCSSSACRCCWARGGAWRSRRYLW